MAKQHVKLVRENIFRLTDNHIRELFPKNIIIYYGFDNYECDMSHLDELKDIILSNYPDINKKDIEVENIHTQSDRHLGYTMLRVRIPTEDFIKLRNENQVNIL